MATTVQALQVAQTAAQGWLDIPWIIWAGMISPFVATLIAGATIWATSRNSLSLLAKQHERDNSEANLQRAHDALQKDEDRKGMIRREVYLQAVEETHTLIGYIGGLPNRPLNIGNEADCLQSFLKANAKVWLVADAEAAHLSRDLASELSEIYLFVLNTTYPIRQAMESVHKRREEILFEEGEARRLLSELNDAKGTGAGYAVQVNLANLVESTKKYIKDLEDQQRRTLADIEPMRKKSFNEIFWRMRPVQRELVKLISALRGELNLPRDDEIFMEQLKDMEQRAWSVINKAFGIDPPELLPELDEST